MANISLDEFYVFDNTDSPIYRWLEFSKRIRTLGPDAAMEAMKDEWPYDAPLPMKVMSGREPADAYGNTALLRILSPRLTEALCSFSHDLVRIRPAVLYDKADRELIESDLRWVTVGVGTGPVDRSRGVYLQDGDLWRRDPELTDAYGLYFDPATWSGADVFTCGGTHVVAMTRRVADAIRSIAPINVELVPLLERGRANRDAIVAAIKRRQG